MDDGRKDKGDDRPHPAAGMDRATQARLVYRLQHIERVREGRQAQAYWARELATQARDELARQRAAARAADEDLARQRAAREADEGRARRRLQAFLAREQAARETGSARRGSLGLGFPGLDKSKIGDVGGVQFVVPLDDADAAEMAG